MSYVSLEGPEGVLDQHRENIVAIAKGPWKTDYFVRVAKTIDEKCNLDADGHPHCPKSHDMKRFNKPEEETACNICK